MKSALRAILINTGSLWVTSRYLEGLSYRENTQTLFLASLALAGVNTLVKPLVKIVALPINFLTLGAFSWLINALMLYLVTLLVPGFTVSAFLFKGYQWQGFVMPEIYFTQFWAMVVASLVISFLANLLNWLCRP